MARPKSAIDKAHINVYLSKELADEFREQSKNHGDRLGLCLSAAMILFLEADRDKRDALVTRVYEAELKGKIDSLIADIEEKRSKRPKSK